MFSPDELTFTAWGLVEVVLKQQDGDETVPAYIAKISRYTSMYEEQLRKLWEIFKTTPTYENAQRLADAMKASAQTLWPGALADILGVEKLTDKQQELLNSALTEHSGFIDGSLLPDVSRVFDEGGVLNGDEFNKYDHRAVFMYAGALWSLGFLATVMFDGTSMRDLADVFLFAGPNDEVTCQGDRGCAQFANKMFTVADIIANDIIPGHLTCLTNCRHMLFPVASPLGKEQRFKGGTGSGNFGHQGRPGVVGGSGQGGDVTPHDSLIMLKTAKEWFDAQHTLSEQWSKEVLDKFDRDKPKTEVTREMLKGYLDRMNEHRRLVLDEGMNIVLNRKPGSLSDPKEFMQRLMVHDKDKYDFRVAEPYIGVFKMDFDTYKQRWLKVMGEHHDNNDHHYHFWAKGGQPKEMLPTAFWEMMADWRGTSRERGTRQGEYYTKHKKEIDPLLHPRTRQAVEYELAKMK